MQVEHRGYTLVGSSLRRGRGRPMGDSIAVDSNLARGGRQRRLQTTAMRAQRTGKRLSAVVRAMIDRNFEVRERLGHSLSEQIRAEFVEEFGRMDFDLISNLEQTQAEICAGMNRAPAGWTCLLTQFFQSWLPTVSA
jgi:hypothetical protein